jgi:hypothetical protein
LVPALDFEGMARQHKISCDLSHSALLQKVFDRVCKEAGVFANGESEREELAIQLLIALVASQDEHTLISAGHSTMRRIRRPK